MASAQLRGCSKTLHEALQTASILTLESELKQAKTELREAQETVRDLLQHLVDCHRDLKTLRALRRIDRQVRITFRRLE